MYFIKHNGFCFAHICTRSLQRERVMSMSARTDSLVSFLSVADYRVHVLRHHAKQVGPADLSARLHEEPPRLPSGPPCTSVALLQLHVHARRVRSQTSTYVMLMCAGLVPLKSGWLVQMMHCCRTNKLPDVVILMVFSFCALCSVWSSSGSMHYCS